MSQTVFEYSIHCLSDGSEYTDTTLLLTVERGTTFCQRYAICGMTTMAARLAADQKLPLHSIRACFGNGLPSILLALSEVGIAEVTWCGFTLDKQQDAEALVKTILGSRRQYPLVRLCQVPKDGIWYQVYDDNYVRAYGKYVAGQITWIYSLLKYRGRTNGDVDPHCQLSIVIIPTKMDVMHLHPLPENIELMCHIFLSQPRDHVFLNKTKYFFTNPSETCDRILRRATRQAQRLNSILPFLIPFRKSVRPHPHPVQLLPASSLCLKTWKINDTTNVHNSNDTVANSQSMRDERVSWNNHEEHNISRELIDKVESVWLGKSHKDENEIDIDEEEEIDHEESEYDTPKALLVPHLVVLGTGCATPSASRGSSGYAILTPNDNHLPSSLTLTAILDCGEGILTNLYRHLPSFVGTRNDVLAHLKLIWISHAHLDHYGGLLDILRACYEARQGEYGVANKRLKTETKATSFSHQEKNSCSIIVPSNRRDDDIPVVVAPFKVLKYLEASFGALTHDKKVFYYYGISHRDWRLRDNCIVRNRLRDILPFTLNSYPVDHGGEAHGVQLDFHEPHKFSLVYSGDTRPCCLMNRSNIVCHPIRPREKHHDRHSQRSTYGEVSLLLHEATFEDKDHAMAVEKRHSTISEAFHVAQQMSAKACLLTHFSQRYSKSSYTMQETTLVDASESKLTPAFAVDGFLVPLTDDAMMQLPAASYLLQRVLQEYNKKM
jgi:ribonuclease BN (tRNA processing enzyme)